MVLPVAAGAALHSRAVEYTLYIGLKAEGGRTGRLSLSRNVVAHGELAFTYSDIKKL